MRVRAITALCLLAMLCMPLIEAYEPTKIGFTDQRQDPGMVFQLDLPTGNLEKVYVRSSGLISSADFILGRLFFSNANDNKIWKTSLNAPQGVEALVYTHSTYVRDIDAVPTGNGSFRVYFSEASGAGGDGRIYYLDGTRALPLTTVRLSDVDGSWAGNFVFDDRGKIYLSSGNTRPASIYLLEISGRIGASGFTAPGKSKIKKIYTDDGPIMGMLFVPPDSIYYADFGSKIYRLDLGTLSKKTVFEYRSPNAGGSWLSDLTDLSQTAP